MCIEYTFLPARSQQWPLITSCDINGMCTLDYIDFNNGGFFATRTMIRSSLVFAWPFIRHDGAQRMAKRKGTFFRVNLHVSNSSIRIRFKNNPNVHCYFIKTLFSSNYWITRKLVNNSDFNVLIKCQKMLVYNKIFVYSKIFQTEARNNSFVKNVVFR